MIKVFFGGQNRPAQCLIIEMGPEGETIRPARDDEMLEFEREYITDNTKEEK